VSSSLVPPRPSLFDSMAASTVSAVVECPHETDRIDPAGRRGIVVVWFAVYSISTSLATVE